MAALVWVALAGRARADELHFFGPEGSRTERRGLVVVAGEDDACAPLDAATAEALDEGVEVTLLEPAGHCARWAEVAADPPRDHVSIRVVHPEGSAVGAVAMGSERGLEVEATLRGDRLLAEVRGAPEGDPVTVVAIHAGGRTTLAREGDVYAGPRPPAGLVGVLARSASLTGADALVVGRVAGPAARIVPSALEIPPGGAPRVAAFLVVVDGAGRLSRNVPLRVVSEHGSLRRLDWLSPGLAAVSLSTREHGVRQVDLSVSDSERLLATVELAVDGGAPVRGELDAPPEARAGVPFDVRASVRTVDDTALAPSRVRVLCPDGTSIPVTDESTARCTVAEAGDAPVTVQALLDGRPVPLGTTTVRVIDPARPAVSVPAPERDAPAERSSPGPGWRIGGFLRGTVDLWGDGGAAAGLRLSWPLGSWLWLGVGARYEVRRLSASPSAQVDLALVDLRHEVGAGAHVALAPRIGAIRWVSRLTLSGSLVRDRYELGGASGRGTGFVPSATLTTGVAFGGRWEISAGATARFARAGDVWQQAPLAFLLELGGTLEP